MEVPFLFYRTGDGISVPGESLFTLPCVLFSIQFYLLHVSSTISVEQSVPRCLLLFPHALLGDQENACACCQKAAYHVEDCGADAAGGGKEGAGLVNNIDR